MRYAHLWPLYVTPTLRQYAGRNISYITRLRICKLLVLGMWLKTFVLKVLYYDNPYLLYTVSRVKLPVYYLKTEVFSYIETDVKIS